MATRDISALTSPLVIGSESNYTQIETDGTITLHGNATVYEDIQINVTTAKVPAVNAPQWTTWNYGVPGGVEFAVLGFGPGDYQDFYIQTQHSMQLNSILDNHIHFSIPSNDAGKKFKFQLDAIVAGVGSAFVVPSGSPFTKEYTITSSGLGYHQILNLANVPALNSTVSTIYVCRLKRIDASSLEYGSNVYVVFNDSHFIKDSLGSSQELIK